MTVIVSNFGNMSVISFYFIHSLFTIIACNRSWNVVYIWNVIPSSFGLAGWPLTRMNVVFEISYTLFCSGDCITSRFRRPYPIWPLLHLIPWHRSTQAFTVLRNCTYVVSGNLNARNFAVRRSPSIVSKFSNKYGSTEHLFDRKISIDWNVLSGIALVSWCFTAQIQLQMSSNS